jgi:type I restriction enzyme S subunit
MSKFPEVLIGDVCSVGDGAHSKVNRVDGGVLYLTSKNIGQGNLKLDNSDYISEESFEKLFPKDSKATRRPQPGDVLFGIIGTFGTAYLYKECDYFGFSSSIGILRPNPEKLYSEYLYYVVSSEVFKRNHANHNGGSVQGYTNIPTVKSLTIPLPSITEQKRIAQILKSLDNKIELNRQTNQTLEQIAQAIFISWFVDFEPVKAKMAAKQAGASAEQIEQAGICAISGKTPQQLAQLDPQTLQQLKTTAALFPDALVDSELGEIPEGWFYKKAIDICEVAIGKTPPRNETEWFSENENDIPWVSIRDMGQSGVYIQNTNEYLTEEAVKKFNVRRVPNNTLLLSFKLTIGRLAITNGEMLTNEAIAHFNLNNLQSISTEYLFLYLKVFDYNSLGSTSSIATAINSSMIKNIPILLPSNLVLESFNERVQPIFSEIKTLLTQIQSLTELRDSLLPPLLSRELLLEDQAK